MFRIELSMNVKLLSTISMHVFAAAKYLRTCKTMRMD